MKFIEIDPKLSAALQVWKTSMQCLAPVCSQTADKPYRFAEFLYKQDVKLIRKLGAGRGDMEKGCFGLLKKIEESFP